MANNIFDPPSPDELDMFSAPTESEQDLFAPPTEAELSEEPRISKTKAVAMGTADSATLGFYDELRGAAGAAGEKIAGLIPGIETPSEVDAKLAAQGFTGDIKPERSLADLYQEYRNIARQDITEAQEDQPVAYYSGVAAGALVPGVGVGGAAAKGATRLQQIIKGSKAGAVAGGIGGLGTSEAELLEGDVGGVAKDVAVGTGTGALFGAGISAAAGLAGMAGRTIKKPLQRAAKESEFGRDVSRAYEIGQEGRGISGRTDTTKLSEEVNLAAKELQDTLFKKLDDNFKEKLKILQSRKGETIDYRNLYEDITDQIEQNVKNFQLNPDEESALLTQLNKRFYEKLPEKVKGALKETVTDVIDPTTGAIKSRTKTTTAKQLDSDIDDALIQKEQGVTTKTVPTDEGDLIKKLSKKTKETTDATTEGVMRGDMSLEEASNFVRDLQRGAFQRKAQSPGVAATLKKTAAKASDILESKAPETGPLNISSSAIFDSLEKIGVNPNTIKRGEIDEGFIKFVKKLDDSFKSPESLAQQKDVVEYLSKAFGKDQANKMIEELQQVSHDYLLGKRANEGEQIRLMSQIFGTIKDLGVKGSNIVGQLKGVGERKIEKVYNMSNDMLSDMARKSGMDPSKSAQKVTEFLEKASTTKNQTTKNAILFSLVQNPEYRKYMKETFGLDEENEDNQIKEDPFK